jgi:CBS domain-containing protein
VADQHFRWRGGRGAEAVEAVMATPPVTVRPTATLRRAAAVLDAEAIGAAPVVDTGGIRGILSERDIVEAIAAGADPDVVTVRSTMAAAPVTVDPETTIGAVADLMIEAGIRHVPVVAGIDVIGVVSMRDVLDALRSDVRAAGGD